MVRIKELAGDFPASSFIVTINVILTSEGKILTLSLRGEGCCGSRWSGGRSLCGNGSSAEGCCVRSNGSGCNGSGLYVAVNTEGAYCVKPTALILAGINIKRYCHNLTHLDIELLHTV